MSRVRVTETVQQADSAMDELSRSTPRSNNQDIERPDDLARDPLPTIGRWQAQRNRSHVVREQAGDGVDPLKGQLRAKARAACRDGSLSEEATR